MMNSHPVEGVSSRENTNTLLNASPYNRGRTLVFAVTSGKPRVGKTTIIANLVSALRERHKRVLVMDAALGWADLTLCFDAKPAFSIGDFLSGFAPLKSVIIDGGDGVFFVPGAKTITGLDQFQKLALVTELDALTEAFDLVLVDTGSGPSDTVTYFASAAQEIIVVITPEVSSLAEGYALIERLTSSLREKRFRIVVNQVTGAQEALALFRSLSQCTLRFLNVSLDFLGWIPYDEGLPICAAHGEPVITRTIEVPSMPVIAALADRLIDLTAGAAQLKGNVQFFLRRMLEDAKAEV